MKKYFPKEVTSFNDLKNNQVYVLGMGRVHINIDPTPPLQRVFPAPDPLDPFDGVRNHCPGRAYVIPICDPSLQDIAPYVEGFVNYARIHPETQFLLSRVGCDEFSRASCYKRKAWKDEQMATLFAAAYPLDNVWIPREWEPTMKKVYEEGHALAAFPPVYSENKLIELTQEYAEYVLEGRPFPEVIVRYAFPEKDCRFHYAPLSEFFYQDGNWYKVDTSCLPEGFQPTSSTNPDEGVVCQLVIFAGIRTRLRDDYGEYIYTGDVLRVSMPGNDYSIVAAVSAVSEGIDFYGLVMDQLSIPVTDFTRTERVGTVFYQLQWDAQKPQPTLWERALSLIPYGAPQWDKMITLAKFTPNFDQEEWKYSSMELLRDEGWFKENEPQ